MTNQKKASIKNGISNVAGAVWDAIQALSAKAVKKGKINASSKRKKKIDFWLG